MTPPRRQICPLGPYMSSVIFEILFIFTPGGPVGPLVAKPATNPWAPGLENSKRSSTINAEPTTAGV